MDARGEAYGLAWKETTELISQGGGRECHKWGEDKDEKEAV